MAARNREAIEHQLSHPEFLALLIQDEVAQREQKKYAMRFRRAGFRHNKTLESFDLDFNPNFNQALLKELASGGFIEEKVAVLITRPNYSVIYMPRTPPIPHEKMKRLRVDNIKIHTV
ncbi:MAG: ATP-binding protein [Gammaproteobacteria bacterium]|nr:ATP-binding protein [Gammaproteobacteria bacterium]